MLVSALPLKGFASLNGALFAHDDFAFVFKVCQNIPLA